MPAIRSNGGRPTIRLNRVLYNGVRLRINQRALTTEQKEELLVYFAVNQYPTRKEKEDIATEIVSNYTKVHDWYNNERRRVRDERREEARESRRAAAAAVTLLAFSEIPVIHFFPLDEGVKAACILANMRAGGRA